MAATPNRRSCGRRSQKPIRVYLADTSGDFAPNDPAILPDGMIDAKAPVMEMRRPIDPKGAFTFHEPPPLLAAAGGDGMTVDRAGWWYVTSSLGVQVFDPTGRLCGVMPKPRPNNPLTSCVLAGSNRDHLCVTNSDSVYRRRLTME